VWDPEVLDLARIGQKEGIFSCPTVFLITSVARNTPSTVNVSVVCLAVLICVSADLSRE
jgi:hypothetical protein